MLSPDENEKHFNNIFSKELSRRYIHKKIIFFLCAVFLFLKHLLHDLPRHHGLGATPPDLDQLPAP
jgi:hypothetical protein